MNRLIAPSRIPYGGEYRLKLPERGMVGQGNNFDALIRSITEWRRANSVPIGLAFEDEVEQAVCEKYPTECKGGIAVKPREGRLKLAEVLRGTRVLLAFKLAGSPLVDPAEAERRAKICASCAWNVEFSKPCGGACGGLREMVSAIVGGRKTSVDDRLRSCAVCGCEARAHVHLPLLILAKGVTDAQREQFDAIENCWKKT